MTLHVFIYEGKEGPTFAYRFDGSGWRKSLKKMPDFRGMALYHDGKKIINGCIVLAAARKEPNRLSDNEADWARVIGLEMKTEPRD